MADGTGVLIIGDATGGQLGSTTTELLAAGQKIAADLDEDLSVALLGDTLDNAAQQAIAHGAQKVFAVNHPLLAEYQVDLQLYALETLCKETSPRVMLIARTNEGRELAPRLAFRLGLGLAQDCLEVSIDSS